MNARETALRVLTACRKDGAWSNSILKEYCIVAGLDRREASLAARLCYGVLQNRARLDFYLKQLLNGNIRKLHPLVHDILLLGMYQIYEMDKIPASAAVNESVILAKKFCKKQSNAASLVNAVLRSAVRTKGSLELPVTLEDKYSHPQSLINMLRAYVGDEQLEPMLAANNEGSPTVIQVNTNQIAGDELLKVLECEDVCVGHHPWMPDCLIISETGSIEQLSAFGKGLFYVQDAAAKLSVLCAGISKGAAVLDCCAAPGGKSFAAAVCGAGSITSCDIHPHKVSLIEKGAKRLGFCQIRAVLRDASDFCPEWENRFDVVIADVPCSGYGIIRKKPDIRYKDPDSMQDLPALQLSILSNQAKYVKPGGTLMYSTCTLVRKENEGVVEKFLNNSPDFYLEPLQLPDILGVNQTGMLRLIPGQYDTDGFFICRMRRKV